MMSWFSTRFLSQFRLAHIRPPTHIKHRLNMVRKELTRNQVVRGKRVNYVLVQYLFDHLRPHLWFFFKTTQHSDDGGGWHGLEWCTLEQPWVSSSEHGSLRQTRNHSWSSLRSPQVFPQQSSIVDRKIRLEHGETERSYREISTHRTVNQVSDAARVSEASWVCVSCCGQVASRILSWWLPPNKKRIWYILWDVAAINSLQNKVMTEDMSSSLYPHYSRMVTCSSIKFSRRQMGYDLRRNETISNDYEDMFASNMYAKVVHNPSNTEALQAITYFICPGVRGCHQETW